MSDTATISAPAPAASSTAPSTATPSSTPSSSTPASATPTPTSAEPGSATAPTEPGPVTYARFDEVNKRMKAAEEFKEKYGWANQFETDPYTFVDAWVDQLAAHPQYQPQILAKAARLLQSRRGTMASAPTPVAEEPQPDVPIADAAGNVTGYTYSASQQKKWQEWNWNAKQSALDERLKPLEDLRSMVDQAREHATAQQHAAQYATTTLAELRQDPYFTQHEAKVKAALMAHPEWGDDVKGAYLHVLRTEVFPTIGTSAEAAVRTQALTQAAGASIHPGQTAPAAGLPPRTATESDSQFLKRAVRYYDAHQDEAVIKAR